MDRFDRSSVREAREVIGRALDSAGKTLGITLSMGTVSFTGSELTARITGKTGTDPVAHARKDWEKHCRAFGLEPGMFGKTVGVWGEKYTVTGISPRSRKYPVLARKESDGKTYRLPAFGFAEGSVFRPGIS